MTFAWLCCGAGLMSSPQRHCRLSVTKVQRMARCCADLQAASLCHPTMMCADYHTAQNTRIRMKFNTGAEAHDWEAVAKKDNLNVIQVGVESLQLFVLVVVVCAIKRLPGRTT